MDLAQSHNITDKGLKENIPLKFNRVLTNTFSKGEDSDKKLIINNTEYIVINRKRFIKDYFRSRSIGKLCLKDEINKNKKIDMIETLEERWYYNKPQNETIKIKANLLNYSKASNLHNSESCFSFSNFLKVKSDMTNKNEPSSKIIDNTLKNPDSDKTFKKLTTKTNKMSTFINLEERSFCKICYEGDVINNKLIKPCKCEGSLKYIHEICLKKWIENQENTKKPGCEICNYKYKIKSIYIHKFSRKKFCDTFKTTSIILIVVSVILILLLSITYMIMGASLNLNDDEKSLTAKILLSILGIINFFICLYFCGNIKRNFFIKKLSDYSIENIYSNSRNKIIEQEVSNVFMKN